MLIGHYGIGLGAKKAAPSLSLGTLFLASQFLDLLWPTFLLLGWEHVKIQPGITAMAPLNFTDYPISHSMFMAIVWAVLFGLVYYLFRKNYKYALILVACVLSHWILDLFVHIPDLPILPGSSMRAGFGLWNNKALSIIIEGSIFIVGLILYLKETHARNKIGIYSFWGLVIFLAAIYIMNLIGPPPTDVKTIAWVGELQWIFIAWAYWVDKNRLTKTKT